MGYLYNIHYLEIRKSNIPSFPFFPSSWLKSSTNNSPLILFSTDSVFPPPPSPNLFLLLSPPPPLSFSPSPSYNHLPPSLPSIGTLRSRSDFVLPFFLFFPSSFLFFFTCWSALRERNLGNFVQCCGRAKVVIAWKCCLSGLCFCLFVLGVWGLFGREDWVWVWRGKFCALPPSLLRSPELDVCLSVCLYVCVCVCTCLCLHLCVCSSRVMGDGVVCVPFVGLLLLLGCRSVVFQALHLSLSL